VKLSRDALRATTYCIGPSISRGLSWCDDLVILDHASTDGTSEYQGLVLRNFHVRLGGYIRG